MRGCAVGDPLLANVEGEGVAVVGDVGGAAVGASALVFESVLGDGVLAHGLSIQAL